MKFARYITFRGAYIWGGLYSGGAYIRDFTVCVMRFSILCWICHNSILIFVLQMKMKMNLGKGRGQATKQCIIIFQDRINGKNRVHLYLIVVNIVIEHLIFDISQRQCRR